MASAAPENETGNKRQGGDDDIDKTTRGGDSEGFTDDVLEIIDDKIGTEEVQVPPIVMEDVSILHEIEDSPLRYRTEKVSFPLTKEDKTDLVRLGLRFDKNEHLTGLSAPQIGINKRAFIFQIKGNPENKEEQRFPKSLWLNPTYRNADGATLYEDYECCTSIKSDKTLAIGPVFRFDRIFYRAYDTEGRILEGEADGFTARVIQHEIDHLDGKLFADYVQPERLISLRDYAAKLEGGNLDELQKGVVPEFL